MHPDTPSDIGREAKTLVSETTQREPPKFVLVRKTGLEDYTARY
jgi:hypothetical protein